MEHLPRAKPPSVRLSTSFTRPSKIRIPFSSLERHLRGGFAVGHVYLKGFGDHENQRGEIRLQNEFLVFSRNGKVEVCVPDLIVVLEADTGLPITTEMLRYGQRVAVVALPCHDLLRSKEALDVIGPAAFGYPEITYTPLARNPTTQGVS